jgi:pantoate--beta-alanine ligase
MGALHEGHLSLLRRARRECDVVVMSLFVNPRQFDEDSDLEGYPRDEARDRELAGGAGVDMLFAPEAERMYPPGFATTVRVGGPAEGLESAHRGRAHFDGVATVVAKLLNIVCPDAAYFGEKDAQQLAVVRRLVQDLGISCAIVACPTVREADGLAMSSRNARLSGEARARARALHAALLSVRESVAAGERGATAATRRGLALLAAAGVEPEYLTLVDPLTMAPLAALERDALAVLAARVGSVRLIDNLPVPVPGSRTGTDHSAAVDPAPAQPTTA